MGVPMIGCECRVCQSQDPRDKRTRTSVLVKKDGLQILVDTSADHRQQMLRAGIRDLDAVIYTHYHVDHILGMDDLRSLNIINRKSIPIYASPETLERIKHTFLYAFTEQAYVSDVPRVIPHVINSEPFFVENLKIIPIPLLHGELPIFGFRIGNFAYCTDVNKIPDESYSLLDNLEVLILGALRFKPHPTHFTIGEAVREAQKIGAKKTYLTHLSHGVLHAEAEEQLPDNIRLCYDELRLRIG